MTIYAVIAPGPDAALKSAVDSVYAGRNFEIIAGQYMVRDTGQTAQQVALKLGAGSAGRGRFIVFPVTTYWGHHRNDLWEWLAANSGQ